MPSRAELVEEFRGEVEALIERYWQALAAPDPNDPNEVVDMADVGQPEELYPDAWVLAISATPIRPLEPGEHRPVVPMRFCPRNQNPLLTGALLVDLGRTTLQW